jgi:hypothetical protein
VIARDDRYQLQRIVRQELERHRQFEAHESEKELAFERDKVTFEENSEHLRSLNTILWQVPLIAMTLTGGLWFGVSQEGMVGDMRRLLLLFAGLANLGLIVVMIRVRYVFERILDAARTFNPHTTVDTQGEWLLVRERVVLIVFCLLMLCAAGISLGAAVASEKLFRIFPPPSSSVDMKALRDRLNQTRPQ